MCFLYYMVKRHNIRASNPLMWRGDLQQTWLSEQWPSATARWQVDISLPKAWAQSSQSQGWFRVNWPSLNYKLYLKQSWLDQHRKQLFSHMHPSFGSMWRKTSREAEKQILSGQRLKCSSRSQPQRDHAETKGLRSVSSAWVCCQDGGLRLEAECS